MESTLEGADAVHRMKPGRKPKVAVIETVEVADFSPAQMYAWRIWEGQSMDVSIPDRVERVVNGLRGQNLSIDVNLPHPDAARFLAKYQ